MYTYMYTYIEYIYVYGKHVVRLQGTTHVYIRICIHIYVYIHICIRVCINYMYICKYVYLYVFQKIKYFLCVMIYMNHKFMCIEHSGGDDAFLVH